ncbi:hypothetical protein HNY73_002696 [Argiope bruennichi]|uniref:Uncharacterized protein n=1 Tax=Argiope bruennichi TaxID=94029 RepID=A0A8T0FUF3_ARGBR|nr:hypothetical protein HNY73_002696 [Argiope bruennichi]
MEKNSDTDDTNSGDSLVDNTENQGLETIFELEKSLFLKQQHLEKHFEDLKKTIDMHRSRMAYLDNLLSNNKIIEHKSIDWENLERLVSPLGSPTHKSQNLSEDTKENLPDSTVSAGSLRKLDAISHSNEEIFDPSEILPLETSPASAREFKDISLNPETSEAMVEIPTEQFQSNISDKNLVNDDIQETIVDIESETSFEINLHRDIMESYADSSENSDRKGKEAANPKFRYKKRSKANVPSRESIAEETPIKHSEEMFDTPETKTPKLQSPTDEFIKTSPSMMCKELDSSEYKEECDTSSCESLSKSTLIKHSKKEVGTPGSKALRPQSSKEEFTRVSPSVKRKIGDSNEQDNDKMQSNESCSKTSPFTKLSGNREDDDYLKIAKKLKFEDNEKPSEQCPYTTSLLLQKKHEELCINLEELIDESETDQSHYASEQLIFQSTSGLSNPVSCIFTSEESSRTDESEDVSSSGTGVSSLFYVSEDVSSSETGESASKDAPSSEIGEPSLANVGEDVPSSEIGESSLANVSEDVPSSEIGESSLASAIEDVEFSDREESYFITVDEDISLSKEQPLRGIREDK